MHTEDTIIDMIYAVPPETRARSIFVCDHKTAASLRRMMDSDGRFLWRDGLDVTEVNRVLGYPVHHDKRRAGLAFGEFEPLPELVELNLSRQEPPK